MSNGNFSKGAFGKIEAGRRTRILDVATAEFAARGYSAANINDIAKKAGISIGSMYSYFSSKEDLFLTVVESGFPILEHALGEVEAFVAAAEEPDLYTLFGALLRAARDYARRYPELNQIYLDATTQSLAALSGKLSFRLETITAELFARVLKDGIASGSVRPDVEPGFVTFFLDDLLIAVQFSFASDYYRERLRVFAGPRVFDDDGEALIVALVKLVRSALAGPRLTTES